MLYTNHEVRIRFSDEVSLTRAWLDDDPVRAQRVLANYHGTHPVCTCVPRGVQMHIVRRGGAFYLATMPGRAHHHALSCPYHIPHPSTDASLHYADTALSRASGLVRLSVYPDPLKHPPFPHFSFSAALEYLWQLAGLNIFMPDMTPRPGLSVAAHTLQSISDRIRINDRHFIPHFPPAPRADRRFTHVIGVIRSLSLTRYGYRVALAGDGEKCTYWINEATWRRCQLFSVPTLFADPLPARYVIMARLWRSPKGFWNLFDPGLLEVNPQMLPVTEHTRSLVNELTQAKRKFFVVPQLDSSHHPATLPAAVLLDTDQPAPLYARVGLPAVRRVRAVASD